MADTTEVEKWTLLHGELVQEDDGPLVWSEDYDTLADKLAEVEVDRDDLLIALASARKQLELYIRKGTLDEPLHSHTWNPPTNFGSKEE